MTIQFRRNTAANATSSNPTLASGEPGFEEDTGKMKIGDGSTAWTSLAYVGAGTGDVVGPGSAVDNAVCRFDSTTGKLIQGSGVTISDSGVIELDGSGERLRITNGSKYMPVEYTSGVLIFGHTYDYGSNTNLVQLQVRYRGSGYAASGIMLSDVANGYTTVLTQTASGQLYIVDGAGSAGGLTLGTRYNPADGSTFVAGYQIWYVTGASRLGVGRSPVAQLDIVAYAAANIVGRFKAHASQTANLLETVNSSESLEFAVAPGGNVSTVGSMSYRSGSADPTNSDIADGHGYWWRNTTSGELRYWANVGGSMKQSAALT